MEVKQKKIGIVTYSLKMGGVESVIYNLAKGFEKNTYEVEIIETLEAGVWKNYFIENNLKVTSIVKKPFINAYSHALKVANYIKKFDILLLHDAPIAQSVLGLLDTKTLVFPILHLNIFSMAFNAAGNKGLWNKIIPVSPFLRSYLLEEQNLIDEKDLVCIPNGIDVNKYSIQNRQKSQEKRILYLGRISEEKGVLLIPSIINSIKDNPNFNTIDIYGSGPLDASLKHEIERYHLQSKINIKGAINPDNVPNILINYDILLMPSYKEGHPIVLLEAMSCGVVPVVTLLEGSTDIVVDHKENGFLCQSGNIEDFANQLNNALNHENLSEISALANKKILKNYSVEKMIASYINLFEKHSNIFTKRSNKIDETLLGEFFKLPYILVRPYRKMKKILNNLFQ